MLLYLLACTQPVPTAVEPATSVDVPAPTPRRVDLKIAVASVEPCDEGVCIGGPLVAPSVWQGIEVRVPVTVELERVKGWTPGRELCVRLDATPDLVRPPAVTQITPVPPSAVRSCERFTP